MSETSVMNTMDDALPSIGYLNVHGICRRTYGKETKAHTDNPHFPTHNVNWGYPTQERLKRLSYFALEYATDTKIIRFKKIVSNANPFDERWSGYYEERDGEKMLYIFGCGIYTAYRQTWDQFFILLVAEFICFVLFFGATAITEDIGRFSEWLAEL